jgi:hypothetical protein
LNYLRDHDTADFIDLHLSLSQADLQALMREAQYYRLNDLRHRITEAIDCVFLTCALSSLLSADLLCSALLCCLCAHDHAETVPALPKLKVATNL